MPRYFIDFQDGDDATRDPEGACLPTPEKARAEAVAMFPEVLRGRFPEGGDRTFVTTARDAAGTPIYRATLTFHGEWLT